MPDLTFNGLQDEIIQDYRLDQKAKAKNLFTIALNSGADFNSTRNNVVECLLEGILAYRNNLITQAKYYSNKQFLDNNNYHKAFNDLIKQPLKLSDEKIKSLRYENKLNSTQAMILHYVICLNKIESLFKSYKEHGINDGETLVNLLELNSRMSNFANYCIDVSKSDYNSYRSFRLLNSLAYSGFTRVWFQKLKDVKLDKGCKHIIEEITAAVKPEENGDIHGIDLNYDAADEMKDEFWRNLYNWFFKQTKGVDQFTSLLSLQVLPSFLSIGCRQADLNKLKVLASELVTRAGESDSNYLDAIFIQYIEEHFADNENKQVILNEFKLFLAQIREIHAKIKSFDFTSFNFKSEIDERNKILKIIKTIEQLRDEELYRNRALGKKEQQDLKDSLLKKEFTTKVKQKLVSALGDLDIKDKDIEESVTNFITGINTGPACRELIKIGFSKYAENNNYMVSYYDALLREARERLTHKHLGVPVGPDAKIVYSIDNLNLMINKYLVIQPGVQGIIRKGDKYSLIFGLFNPTKPALKGSMPYSINSRIDELYKIRFMIKYCEIVINKTAKSISKNDDSRLINDAYGRLKDSLTRLKELEREYSNNNILIVLAAINKSIQNNLLIKHANYKKRVQLSSSIWSFINFNNIFFNNLSLSDQEHLESLDQLMVVKLNVKINKIKSIINNGGIVPCSNLAALYNEVCRVSRHYGFDIENEIKANLKLVANLQNGHAKAENFKHRNNILFIDNEGLALKTLKYFVKLVFVSKKVILNSLYFLRFTAFYLCYIPSSLFKIIGSKTKVNKKFSLDIAKLIEELDDFKQKNSGYSKDVAKLIRSANFIKNSIGCFTVSFERLYYHDYKNLIQAFETIKRDATQNKYNLMPGLSKSSAKHDESQVTDTKSIAMIKHAEHSAIIDHLLGLEDNCDTINSHLRESGYRSYVNYLLNEFLPNKHKLFNQMVDKKQGEFRKNGCKIRLLRRDSKVYKKYIKQFISNLSMKLRVLQKQDSFDIADIKMLSTLSKSMTDFESNLNNSLCPQTFKQSLLSGLYSVMNAILTNPILLRGGARAITAASQSETISSALVNSSKSFGGYLYSAFAETEYAKEAGRLYRCLFGDKQADDTTADSSDLPGLIPADEHDSSLRFDHTRYISLPRLADS